MRASYTAAMHWVAHNDDDSVMDEEQISEQVTVLLVADLFKLDAIKVARDIIKERQKAKDEEG